MIYLLGFCALNSMNEAVNFLILPLQNDDFTDKMFIFDLPNTTSLFFLELETP